jgi:hypothetical protein
VTSILEREAASGRWGRVIWAVDARGRHPAREFFGTLVLSDQAKVQALFGRLAELGPKGLQNREKFKSLGRDGGDLWEFKSFQVRFLGDFRPGYRFVVAHGLVKKRDRLDRADIDRALRILGEHDQRIGKT